MPAGLPIRNRQLQEKEQIMGTYKTIEEAREYFSGDRFATTNGMVIDELEEDRCVCSMDLREDHKNGTGTVMGGVMFTLADFALAVISNHIYHPSVAQELSIHFLTVPRGDRLTAEAVCVKSGKRTTVLRISVRDGEGREAAILSGTSAKL